MFGNCANHCSPPGIDDYLRHAPDIELIRQVGEFGGFDPFRADHCRVFHGNLMCEQHGPRAMRSGRGYKYLQVQGFDKVF
jgi:hypothetical protein